MIAVEVVHLAALAFAAGYLSVMRRRSRRAAGLGLAAVALFLLSATQFHTGVSYERALRLVGVTDARALRRAELWAGAIHLAVANGLLVWAVLADRPPVADDE